MNSELSSFAVVYKFVFQIFCILLVSFIIFEISTKIIDKLNEGDKNYKFKVWSTKILSVIALLVLGFVLTWLF